MEVLVNEHNGETIQYAIDRVFNAGGGRVVLAPGTYLCRTLYLKSNVELYISDGAQIEAVANPELYDDVTGSGFENIKPENSRKCLIAALNAENIAITGTGKINGMGPAFYDTKVPDNEFFLKPPHPRPRMLQFCNCHGVRIFGITLFDSPGWTVWLRECRQVQISQIRIVGCQQMINNDGIDIDGCSDVAISDSFFQTGDDCLVLRAIRNEPDREVVCENVVVSNCVLDSRCQGIRIGCPSDDTIRNCQFRGIIFNGKGTGILFNYPVGYLRKNCTGFIDVSNLQFSDFSINAGGWPVRISVDDGIQVRRIANLTFSNFHISALQPLSLVGSTESLVTGVRLTGFTGCIDHVEPLELKNVADLQISGMTLSGRTGRNISPVVLDRSKSNSWECQF